MTSIQIHPVGFQPGIVLSLCLCLFAGCGESSDTTTGNGASPSADPSVDSQTDIWPQDLDLSGSDIQFKDSVTSNVEVPVGLDNLVFVDKNGDRIALETYLGKNNIVLVFTEGFAGGMLCPFCKTQTSRLVANFDRFEELDTKVIVVYPGARDHLDEFIEAATKTEKKQVSKIPFPLVLDEKLEAVKFFNISSNLAHPSTFIIDKQGNVRLAYVGADMTADRPSISSMLKILSDAEQESADSDQ